ncbi:uncharacterized protein [Equus caballus]|uniref:uncharacterized protein isoform X1 n=1 Tax=Equus caballus TaxID=9796 RepID=UPI0038B35FA4
MKRCTNTATQLLSAYKKVSSGEGTRGCNRARRRRQRLKQEPRRSRGSGGAADGAGAAASWAARAPCSSPWCCRSRRHCRRAPAEPAATLSTAAPHAPRHPLTALRAAAGQREPRGASGALQAAPCPRGRRLGSGERQRVRSGHLAPDPCGPWRDDHGAERAAGEGSAEVQHHPRGARRPESGEWEQREGRRPQHPQLWGEEAATGAHHRDQERRHPRAAGGDPSPPGRAGLRAVGIEPHFFDRNYEKGLEWYSSQQDPREAVGVLWRIPQTSSLAISLTELSCQTRGLCSLSQQKPVQSSHSGLRDPQCLSVYSPSSSCENCEASTSSNTHSTGLLQVVNERSGQEDALLSPGDITKDTRGNSGPSSPDAQNNKIETLSP